MSQIHEKSPKHCANKHQQTINFPKFKYKKLFFYFSTFFLSLLSLIFLVWLILHPTKPQFSLKQADVNQLNLSGPSLLNSSIQLTILSHNPNKKVGIYYDELLLYASYKGQKITPDTLISPFYQDHDETDLLSASLIGNQQPVAPSFAYEVQRDQIVGKMILNFKVMGRLRWKVGTYVSGRYRFVVSCVAVMPFGGPIPSPPLSSRLGSKCSTTIWRDLGYIWFNTICWMQLFDRIFTVCKCEIVIRGIAEATCSGSRVSKSIQNNIFYVLLS